MVSYVIKFDETTNTYKKLSLYVLKCKNDKYYIDKTGRVWNGTNPEILPARNSTREQTTDSQTPQ